MRACLVTAGELLHVRCDVGWVSRLIEDAGAGEWQDATDDDEATATVRLVVEDERGPFAGPVTRTLTRGVQLVGDAVVFDDACSSGFALWLQPRGSYLDVRARYCPSPKVRLAGAALRSRFVLLARAVLLQYPVLWWAGTHGRVPVHVSTMTTRHGVAALAGPSGVGKSTLLAEEVAAGESATCDNLAVTDGRCVFGLVEPLRSEAGTGRRTTHGRRESALGRRVDILEPGLLVAVSLAGNGTPVCRPTTPEQACRTLVTGTYMAGELRRYWPFAATLAAGTGLGPPVPPVEQLASRLANHARCYAITLSRVRRARFADLVTACLDDAFPRLDGDVTGADAAAVAVAESTSWQEIAPGEAAATTRSETDIAWRIP